MLGNIPVRSSAYVERGNAQPDCDCVVRDYRKTVDPAYLRDFGLASFHFHVFAADVGFDLLLALSPAANDCFLLSRAQREAHLAFGDAYGGLAVGFDRVRSTSTPSCHRHGPGDVRSTVLRTSTSPASVVSPRACFEPGIVVAALPRRRHLRRGQRRRSVGIRQPCRMSRGPASWAALTFT